MGRKVDMLNSGNFWSSGGPHKQQKKEKKGGEWE